MSSGGEHGGALRRFLEEAGTRHLPNFDAWFVPVFAWRRLCADLPDMAARAGQEVDDPEALEGLARDVFQAAHLVTLGVLASLDEDDDPHVVLQELAAAPDDEEDTDLERLVGTGLTAVEEHLAGTLPDPGPEPLRAAEMLEMTWPVVGEVLGSSPAAPFERAGAASDLLWGIARVAGILAVFRWMVSGR